MATPKAAEAATYLTMLLYKGAISKEKNTYNRRGHRECAKVANFLFINLLLSANSAPSWRSLRLKKYF